MGNIRLIETNNQSQKDLAATTMDSRYKSWKGRNNSLTKHNKDLDQIHTHEQIFQNFLLSNYSSQVTYCSIHCKWTKSRANGT